MVSQYLTTQEVAAMFRTSPETVRYWRHVNAGPPSFKVGRRVLYDATGVERWLAEQQAATTARTAS
jgi:hypothetical protein